MTIATTITALKETHVKDQGVKSYKKLWYVR